jgi:cytochrome c2
VLHYLAFLVAALAPTAVALAGDASASRQSAATNYMLHCQGCHMADGSGRPNVVPALRDSVSRFLRVPDGRAYLGRVPGTSQSFLDDHDRAAVLNWIVTEFDPRHLPADFSPYTAQELARYRRNPESRANVERARLLTLVARAEGKPAATARSMPLVPAASTSGTAPPAAFAVCTACHSTSADGASAMGPNLRGVFGRRAGTLSGFSYSAAMRAAQIVWTREELEAYLTNVARKLPGTTMAFGGVADPADRTAIIDYLETLK